MAFVAKYDCMPLMDPQSPLLSLFLVHDACNDDLPIAAGASQGKSLVLPIVIRDSFIKKGVGTYLAVTGRSDLVVGCLPSSLTWLFFAAQRNRFGSRSEL